MKIKEHYGWIDIGHEKIYNYIRRTHHFLTDDNHIMEDTGESIIILRNKKSPKYHPLTPMWARITNYWFSIPYKKDK